MRLILVRHGETWFNHVGLTQGWCDSPLTEKGQAQARRLGELLEDIKIDAAYSSSSERAYDTACIVLEGRNIAVERDRRLKELHFGKFEGFPNSFRIDFAGNKKNRMELGYRKYGGEDPADVISREMDFLERVSNENTAESTVLIAGHGASLRMLLFHLAEESLRKHFPEFEFFHNATAVLLSWENGSFEAERIIEVEL